MVTAANGGLYALWVGNTYSNRKVLALINPRNKHATSHCDLQGGP